MEGLVDTIVCALEHAWTLVAHNVCNGITCYDVETTCNMLGATLTRIVTICSADVTQGVYVNVREHAYACAHL